MLIFFLLNCKKFYHIKYLYLFDVSNIFFILKEKVLNFSKYTCLLIILLTGISISISNIQNH